ncbi:uncharacterized protein isoform X3 [Rhodnius prolixus]|uniref:uncharacterized protein isoform X3 n=1 Tax=Rhodnius prolixus TaxID=13249 RepID=UPI003D18BD94
MVSDQKKDIEKFTAEDVINIGKNKEKFDSPIDITFSILSYISLPLLEWNNEHQPPRFMKLTNSGVSVILSGKWNGPRPFLRNGPLLGDYIFSQMHFHWGPLEEGGSEHTFDGIRMPLEMHVMFFKSDYLCQEEAMKNNDGILNLAFLTEINCFRYIHNHNREMVKSNFRSTKPVQKGKIFHVNPQTLYNKHLIIPLSEILATKLTKRSNPKIMKIPRKKYNPVNVKKNKKNKESFKISDIHYCFGPSETDETDELDSSTEENTPTIENTSMDESAIKIVFDSITNFKEGSENNIKSLLGKRDSLKEISKLFDMKQGSDESYSDFLERVENYLKNIIAKVEAEKMKFSSDMNRYNNKDDNHISLQAIKCTRNMFLAENLKKLDAFTNAVNVNTEEQLVLNKYSAPLENAQVNFPQSEKNPLQPSIVLPVPKIELNQKRVSGSTENVSRTKCEDLENTEYSFNRKPTPNTQLTSSPINKEKNTVLITSLNNEHLKENNLNIRIQSEKLTPTIDTEINKEDDKNNKVDEMDSLISTDTLAIMSVDEKKTAISVDDIDDDVTVEIPTAHKVQSNHYIKQPQPNPNKLKNIPSKALKQASHSTSRGGEEPPANKGAAKPEVDKFAKPRKPQLKSTLVTEIFIGQHEILNPSSLKPRPLSRKQQKPTSSPRPVSSQQPISRQQPVLIKKPVSRQKPISSQQFISEQYSAFKRPQLVTNMQKESAGKIKEVERSIVQTRSVTPNKPSWKY